MKFKSYLDNFYIDKKISLKYFWIPRLLFGLLLIIFYSYIHLPNDDISYTAPNNVFTPPDIDDYSTQIDSNTLYAISYQLFFNNPYGILLGVIFGNLISGYSCLSILKSFKNIINKEINTKLILFLMAINPILVLYSQRFCTENFALLGIAFFFKMREYEFSSSFKKGREDFLLRWKLIFYQFLIVFYRSQFLPIFAFELFFEVKRLFKYFQNKSKFKRKFLIFITLISLLILLSLISIANREYFTIIRSFLWDSNFPLTASDIYRVICTRMECTTNFINRFLIVLISYGFYLFTSIITLTGARGRLTDGPWRIQIGEFSIENLKPLNENYDIYFQNFNESYFIIVVILPFLIFSIFNLIGIISWIKSVHKIGLKIWFIPLSICFLPLIFYPYLRYYIPLIPLSCIGIGILFSKRQKKQIQKIGY